MVIGLYPTHTSSRGIGITFHNTSHESWVRQFHLPQVTHINFGADPALVFGEILGVIKGSEQAIGTKNRCLDQDTYVSSGRQGMFSHTKEAVYELFNSYTTLKRRRQEFDAADRSAGFMCSPNKPLK